VKKILFINDFAEMGGAEIALFDLVTGLDRKQFKSEVLLFEDGPLRDRLLFQEIEVSQIIFAQEFLRMPMGAKAIQVARLIKLVFQVGWRTKAVARHIASGKYEAVITNSFKALLVTWLALRFVRSKPKHFHYLHYIFLKKRTVGTRLVAFLMSKTDCLVCNSQATLTQVRLHSASGKKTAIIRQGFDRGTPMQEVPKSGDWIIGSAGRINPIKNYELIIDAARLLKDQHPNLRVHIAGEAFTDVDRRYKMALHEHIERSGMGDVVVFKGFTKDIWSFMDSLNVFMLCSYRESFGRVLAEAMWSGRPIIATHVGAIPEIIQNEVTGYTVEIGDATRVANLLEFLIKQPAEARLVGLSARSYAEKNLSYGSYIAAWQSCLLS
jgi:glycosyltransferase involved in cell wall biosynthesis